MGEILAFPWSNKFSTNIPQSNQSFKQRKANEKFANRVAKERKGEIKKAPKASKAPKLNVPTWILVLVVFALLGSGILEILRIFF